MKKNRYYDCCNYCCCLDDKELCKCDPDDYIKDDFTCDFYVPNFEKACKEAWNEAVNAYAMALVSDTDIEKNAKGWDMIQLQQALAIASKLEGQ